MGVSPAISRSSNNQSPRFERKGRKQRTSGRPSNRSSNNPFARNLDRKRSKRQKKKMDRESYHTPIERETPSAQVSWSMDSEIEEPVTRYQIVDSDGGSMRTLSYVDFDDTM